MAGEGASIPEQPVEPTADHDGIEALAARLEGEVVTASEESFEGLFRPDRSGEPTG